MILIDEARAIYPLETFSELQQCTKLPHKSYTDDSHPPFPAILRKLNIFYF